MSLTPSCLSLAQRLVESGVPEGLAAVLAHASTAAPGERSGEAAACVLDEQGALRVTTWLETQLAAGMDSREALVTILGAAALLFGAEEAGRLVLSHMPSAVQALEEMMLESEDAAADDPMLASAAKAEALMLQAALARAAAEDPRYNHGLYMDESVVLPGFLLAARRGSEAVELNGALVSTPGGLVFVLSDGMLSAETASLLPEGALERGSVAFRLDEIAEAVFLVPESFGGADAPTGVDFGRTPDGEVHAYIDVRGHGLLSICLAYSHWPAARQEVLRRRFETLVERVGSALHA